MSYHGNPPDRDEYKVAGVKCIKDIKLTRDADGEVSLFVKREYLMVSESSGIFHQAGDWEEVEIERE